ncbi:hypothetical protein JQ596_06425 [Bradyrhizobium manausense]|uniref:hypothetical protein n=1 Tax=Bradyrhizobium manausense TaxID=989370 RepID=UPI001BAC01BC|nr:hypothetical protein [Bradyrhizobium manausense]MBR0825162.1 hypothetical protein [Bradyrhizobium manausense]
MSLEFTDGSRSKHTRGCARWRFFPAFYRDVGGRPSWRHLFVRDDPSGAFEPGNARWQIAARIDGRDRRPGPGCGTA